MNNQPYFQTPRIRSLLFALALVAPCVLLADPVDWTAYKRSFEVSFTGYVGSSTLQDFPALVRVSPQLNGFDYSKCKVPGGGDLRFSDEEGNLLDSEVDTWVENGESLVWVKVPSLNTTTRIVAHYSCASPAEVTPANVWSADYVGVWHLNESGVPMAESSGVSTPFSTAGGSGLVYGATGAIGGAVDFSGGNTYARLSADDDDDLDGFTDFTFEVWTKQETAPSSTTAYILAKRSKNEEDVAYILYNNKSSDAAKHGRNIFGISVNGTSLSYPVGSGHNMQPQWGEWCHQAFVRNAAGNKGLGYLNGIVINGMGTGSDPVFASTSKLHLGNAQGNGVPFNGLIDELRISRVARSADWLQASHDTVSKADFAAYSAEKNDWNAYSHKFTVAFTNAFSDATTLQNFPVLVRIAEYDESTGTGIQGFDYDDCIVENGGDLRFADENGILLQSEVDTWNPNGESLVWVKVPSLSSETVLTAYYGCILPGEVTPSEVWSEGYVGVWHLGESALPLVESSGVSTPFNGSYNHTETLGVAGKVGGAVDFTTGNTNVRLAAADDPDLDGFTDMTIEVWTKQDGPSTTATGGARNAFLLAKRTKSSEDAAYILYSNSAPSNDATHGRNILWLSSTGTSWLYPIGSGHNMIPTWGEWCHQAFVRNTTSNKTYGYVDGTVFNGNTTGTDPLFNSTSPLYLGNSQGGGGNPFNGLVDELRISRVARTAAWLKASRETVAMSNFASCGSAKTNARCLLILFR